MNPNQPNPTPDNQTPQPTTVQQSTQPVPVQTTPAEAPPSQPTQAATSTTVAAPPPDSQTPSAPAEPEQMLVSWNAPEFIYTHKPAGWYLLLGLFFIALIVIAILTRQWLSIAVFAVMGVAVAVYANRKPRMLNYSITTRGLQVGEKHYEYNQFSAYFEADDYGQRVFELIPTKRFAPLVSLPATQEHNQQIEQSLTQKLPQTAPQISFVERLFKALRF